MWERIGSNLRDMIPFVRIKTREPAGNPSPETFPQFFPPGKSWFAKCRTQIGRCHKQLKKSWDDEMGCEGGSQVNFFVVRGMIWTGSGGFFLGSRSSIFMTAIEALFLPPDFCFSHWPHNPYRVIFNLWIIDQTTNQRKRIPVGLEQILEHMPFIPSSLGTLWNSCNLPNINNSDHLLLKFLYPGPSWILILPAAFGAGTSGNLDPKWCFFWSRLVIRLPLAFSRRWSTFIMFIPPTEENDLFRSIQRSNKIS